MDAADARKSISRHVAKIPMTDAPAIKQNANGVWHLEGEQLWDSDILPVCLEHIKEGDTVIDAGAWIGGHTMSYSKKVGVTGKVHAFEPNPSAFECLKRNTEQFESYVTCDQVALGDKLKSVVLLTDKGWYDSGYIVECLDAPSYIMMSPLDDYNIAPNFIKIDVEGCELKVLKGAEKTIEKHKPVMCIEVNKPALERQGNTREQVFDWLYGHDYVYQTIGNYMGDVYNILALP